MKLKEHLAKVYLETHHTNHYSSDGAHTTNRVNISYSQGFLDGFEAAVNLIQTKLPPYAVIEMEMIENIIDEDIDEVQTK